MKTHKWMVLAPRRARTVPAENPTGALRVNLLGQAAYGILAPALLSFASFSAAPAATHGYHADHHAHAHHRSSHVRNGVSDDTSIRWMY